MILKHVFLTKESLNGQPVKFKLPNSDFKPPINKIFFNKQTKYFLTKKNKQRNKQTNTQTHKHTNKQTNTQTNK